MHDGPARPKARQRCDEVALSILVAFPRSVGPACLENRCLWFSFSSPHRFRIDQCFGPIRGVESAGLENEFCFKRSYLQTCRSYGPWERKNASSGIENLEASF